MISERDTQPWYRHFWPWFIIAMLGTSVSASLYTVYLAVSTAEPVIRTTDGNGP